MAGTGGWSSGPSLICVADAAALAFLSLETVSQHWSSCAQHGCFEKQAALAQSGAQEAHHSMPMQAAALVRPNIRSHS